MEMDGTNKSQSKKTAAEAMPGSKPGTILHGIYNYLMERGSITTLDAVFCNQTVCLAKYISIMRDKYGINIKDEWVHVGMKQKRVKKYTLIM